MSEELIDKYLNQSLNEDEEEQFLTLLKDDQFGRFLVKYCVEVHGYHATAAKMLEDDLEKNKDQWIDVEKTYSGRFGIMSLVAVAALMALGVFIFLPVSAPELASSKTLTIERNGKKILADSFEVGDMIKGSEQKLTFADGSKVILSGSLKVLSLGNGKKVDLLSGMASFKVAKQPDKSFKIKAGDCLVEVVGTSFSVSKKGQETGIEVTEGTVKFSNQKQSILLHKGEKAVDVNGVLKAELKNSIKTVDREQRDADLVFEMDFDGENPLDKYGLKGQAVLKSGEFVEGMLADSKALKDGLIEISGTESENFRIPMTINAWIKVNESSIYGPILTKGDTSWRMQLSEDGRFYHGGFGLTDMNEYFNSESLIKRNMWQMVTLVYTDKLALIYVDGKFDGKKSTELMHLNNRFPIQIGGNIEMPDRYFKGLIDSVSIYKRALSEEEILLLYGRMIKN